MHTSFDSKMAEHNPSNARTSLHVIGITSGGILMPYLLIQTNQQIDTAKSQLLLQNSSKTVANLLGKPENYVMVAVQASVPMLFAGNDQPAAFLQLSSLGLPESSTAEFSAVLCDLVHQELGVSPNRIYIQFNNPDRHLWGWNKGTF